MEEKVNNIPLENLEPYLTDEALRIVKEAQSECFLYRKKSVVSTLLLLSFLKNNINLGIPQDKARQLVAPSAEEVPIDPPISSLVVEAIQHSLELRKTFFLQKCDVGLLILGFLSLKKGLHLDLFKQFGVDRVFLYNQYMRNYLVQQLTDSTSLEQKFSLFVNYQLLADKQTQGKLEQIIGLLEKRK